MSLDIKNLSHVEQDVVKTIKSMKSGNGASLIDFGGDILSSNNANIAVNPLEAKSNTSSAPINIFEFIDFNALLLEIPVILLIQLFTI